MILARTWSFKRALVTASGLALAGALFAGCSGSLSDSTASTLSHETFETMTDPDVVAGKPAWNNQYGEIGDLCSPADGVATGNVLLGMDTWEIQPEYDDNVHDCSYSL